MIQSPCIFVFAVLLTNGSLRHASMRPPIDAPRMPRSKRTNSSETNLDPVVNRNTKRRKWASSSCSPFCPDWSLRFQHKGWVDLNLQRHVVSSLIISIVMNIEPTGWQWLVLVTSKISSRRYRISGTNLLHPVHRQRWAKRRLAAIKSAVQGTDRNRIKREIGSRQ